MDHRTRDRLATALDIAPWAVATVAVFAVAATLITLAVTTVGAAPVAQGRAATPRTVAIDADVLNRAGTFDPYPAGATLPTGFAEETGDAVSIEQVASTSRAVRVAVIGDSLTVGATPGLKAFLPDVNLRIDARVSRPMAEGPKAAAATKASTADIVVVALGSNDSCDVAECRRRVDKVLAAVNPQAIVVWMQPARFRPNMDNVRAAVTTEVGGRPRSVIMDWDPFVVAHPEILRSDGIHCTPEGYRLRAEVTADRVHSFIAPG